MTGVVFRIARFAVHDGPGIRTTVFLKGCPLRCWWCHSPESQSPLPELALRPERCLACGTCLPFCPRQAIGIDGTSFITDRERCEACGACADACPAGAREIVGTRWTPDQLLAEIEKDVLFYDESGGGVTFSGGEPTMQSEFLIAMLTQCRARRIHTVVDTCGLAPEATFRAIAGLADLFLFDLKAMDDRLHREVTGASNARILANLSMLGELGRNVRVRFPLIPGINDDEGHVLALGRFVRLVGVTHVDVLPYHRAGIAKYVRFGVEYRLPDAVPPPPERVDEVVAALRACGLQVQIGG